MKTRNSFLKVSLIIATVTMMVLVTTQFAVGQGWYNTAWLYRRAVTVPNPGATTLTDFQVKINLNSSTPFDFTKAKNDGSDIRVTSDNGTTLIPFWIESWNAGTQLATIWVKVPTVPTSGTTVLLYYGNATATSTSNGSTTFSFFDDFESWNLGTGSTGWADITSMPSPAKADNTAAVVNGKLYCIGGYGTNGSDLLDEVFEYDPGTNLWTAKALMPTPRWGMLAVEFNGLIYVFAGQGAYNNKNEVYDPVNNTWDVSKAAMPANLANQGLMGVKYGDKIHLFYMNAHYEYNPGTDSYTLKANVPRQLTWSTCAVVGSKIYIIGGYSYDAPTDACNVNYEYDPATDTWATKALMPVSRYGATRENPVINGKIYVTHGHAGTPFFVTNYAYDPATNTWAQKGSAAYPRDGVGCGVINNKLYVVGGRDVPGNPYGVAWSEVYDPAADTWVPPSGPELWTTSGTGYVYADASAKYQGNYGMKITNSGTDFKYAQSLNGFGSVYALDFNWNVTSLGSGSGTWPETEVRVSELPDYLGNVYFYNEGTTQVLRWYTGAVFSHLVNSTRNIWHKVTIVRNNANHTVTFDETTYGPLTGPSYGAGTGKFRFGQVNATTQYLDNVRVRQWAGADPTTVVLVEQTQCPPAAPIVSSPVTYCVGATATPLTATGSNLLWYTLPTGGTGSTTAPIPSTDTQGATSYYVSQTVNGCEGPRAQIDVVVNPNPEIPTADVTQPICSLPTGTITVTSSIQGLSFSIDGSNYSNTSGIFSSLIPGIYYLTARNSSNCISPAATVIVNPVTGTPDAPTANVTQPNCNTPTGTIIITAPTGAGMTYSKDGSDYTNNTGTFTGVAPGTYSLTAKTIQGCISAATIIVLNAPPGNNLGTWFDANWPYRRAVSVANSSGTTLTNYQVLITLNSSFDFTRAKNDGSDIRIAGSDGTTLIPFWIESWDAGLNQANIWVNVPSIPISGTSIFLYYGNNAATNASNGSSTFDFFDDFESWASPSNAWADKALLPTPKADHTCAVYNGKLYAIGGYNLTAGDARGENYEYNPATNSWAIKTPMPTPRWGPVAVEFNGKIYVFGGQLSNGSGTAKNEMYDPVNDTWSGSAMGNPLLIPDYGASGVVHPDVIYFPEGKDGYKYWMTYTPYPPQPDENPSVVRSNDGITWTGNGISNPVIPEGTPGSWNDLENPDPDFIYVCGSY